jgi:hypothetical protein
MAAIERPNPTEYAEYYRRYVDLVPDGDLIDTLVEQFDETALMLGPLTDEEASRPYAPGKWSIKEVVGHVIDTERIFTYRALRIARGDQTPLAGYDQDAFVKAAGFNRRTLAGLLSGLHLARRSATGLFGGLSAEELARTGVANDNPVSVRAIAWIVAGHERHHVKIIRERYLPR